MIIKISKIISCSSEHPLYPSSNLLEHPPKSSWRCGKPNELIATIIFQLTEPSCITGLEIGNYRSCFVVIKASTIEEPDTWIPIVNHQFLSYDEAVNNKFRDQVQLFTKRELSSETIKIKFNRVKVICMQSANPRELFGLEFIILKTEVTVDLDLDVFGQFKLKEQNDNKVDDFKEKYLKVFENKKKYKAELEEKEIKPEINKLFKKQENLNSIKKPIFETYESGAKLSKRNSLCLGPLSITNYSIPLNNKIENKKYSIGKNKNSSPITQTLFGNIISSSKRKKKMLDEWKINKDLNLISRNHFHYLQSSFLNDEKITENHYCFLCNAKSDELCKVCNLLPESKLFVEKVKKISIKIFKPKKEFNKLFEDISFSLSGYANPQRDEIRSKALKMGAKYIIDPNLTNNKCTHLICCFKNTPKYQQLKGHCKIVGHEFIEDCFNNKKRIPWRRYALDSKEKNETESEEEIDGNMLQIQIPNTYEQDTDYFENSD